MRGNYQEGNDPALIALSQLVVPQKQVLILLVLLPQLLQVRPALLVGVGIGEGELRVLHCLAEDELELKHEFFLMVEGKVKHRSRQSVPLSQLPVLSADTIDRAIEMVAFGLGKKEGTMAKRKWRRWTEKETLRLLKPPVRK